MILLNNAIAMDSKNISMIRPDKNFKSIEIDWILEHDLDYRFILPKTQMNKNSWILWLHIARVGSE